MATLVCADPTEEPRRSCYLCRQMRRRSEFTKRIDDRYYNMCKPCVSEIQSVRAKGKQRLPHTDTHRVCYLCRRTKENAGFQRRSNGTYFSACKDCNYHVLGPRRRARKMGAEGSYTRQEWDDLVARHECCPRCKRRWEDIPLSAGQKSPITVDHIIPLERRGSNDISNIQPLCKPCNSQKGNRLEAA
jgi:5-methylcytosine-specific restriction endonuclease McrA